MDQKDLDIISDRWFNQATTLENAQIQAQYAGPSRAGYYRPWRFINALQSGISKVEYGDSNQLKIMLDVTQFPKANIEVLHDEKYIIVKGHHGMIKDRYGTTSREFERKYFVPTDIDLNTVKSEINVKGMLTITAIKKATSLVGSPLSEISEED